MNCSQRWDWGVAWTRTLIQLHTLLTVLYCTHVLLSSRGRLPLPLEPAVDPSRSDDVDGVASTCHQCAMIPPVCIISTWAPGSSDEDTAHEHVKQQPCMLLVTVVHRCKLTQYSQNTILIQKVLKAKTLVAN